MGRLQDVRCVFHVFPLVLCHPPHTFLCDYFPWNFFSDSKITLLCHDYKKIVSVNHRNIGFCEAEKIHKISKLKECCRSFFLCKSNFFFFSNVRFLLSFHEILFSFSEKIHTFIFASHTALQEGKNSVNVIRI